MKNKRQDTGLIQFTAAGTLTSGQGFLLGETFGVIGADAIAGEEAVLHAQPGNVFELPCLTTDVIGVGDSLYWDVSADELTLVATANWFAGKAANAAGNGVVLVELMIVNGSPTIAL